MRIVSLLLLLLLFTPAQAEEGWIPYWFPADPATAPDYMGIPASTFNAGKDVLDAPAGKHGFVKVKDGHFYFEDGTRARFWGTNLCFSACFPDHKQAEIMANRIAYFGFNAVRLHHMDSSFAPKGIFEDIIPTSKDPQEKPSGHLSPTQLDKLDYLIYQLKSRGIYVDINLLVSRHFTIADGIPDADKLGAAAKPVSLFDVLLIELQKQYARDLLTHLNPYTKLRYCDDPAVCLVEINNENTLIELNPSSLPAYYQNELNNLTENGKINLSELEKRYLTDMKEFLHKEIGVKVPVGIGGHWNPKQSGIQADCLDYLDKHAYWDHPKFPHTPYDSDDFTINNISMLKAKGLGIFAIVNDTANLSEKTNKPFTVSEWNHCYPNKYAYQTPLLLAAKAKQNDWDAIFQFAFAEGWNPKWSFGNIHSFFDINSNAQQLILCSFGSLIYLKEGNIVYNIDTAGYKIEALYVKAAVGEKSTAVLLLKNKYAITIGQIKNTGSGWNILGKFNWGNSPTLMQQIDQ